MKKLILLTVSIFVFVFHLQANQMFTFSEKLIEKKMYDAAIPELLRYLYFSQNITDKNKATFYIGYCHYNMNEFPKAIKLWKELLKNELSLDEKLLLKEYIASSYFLNREFKHAYKWYGKFDTEEQAILKAACLIMKGKVQDAQYLLKKHNTPIGNKLLLYCSDYITKGSKNPYRAMLFSAIVPGAGQLYCRLPGDALSSFILNVLTGGLSVWAHLNGTNTERAIYTTIFLFFYGGNIYGAYGAARNYQQDRLILLENKTLRSIPYNWINLNIAW